MTAAPPDWYPNPDDPAQLRYWDGSRWTEHVAALPVTAAAAAAPKGGSTWLINFRTGWGLIAAGLVCGVAGVLLLVGSVGSAFTDMFFSDTCLTPCSLRLNLNEGKYLVFEQVGSSDQVGPVTSTRTDAASITPADVTVTAPTGERLEVTQPGSNQTIDRNGTMYGGVASFNVPKTGTYELSVNVPGPTQIFVAPDLGRTMLKALPGFATAVVASIALLVGLVVLLTARGRRPNA